jgi:hypothetical protein
LRCVELRCVALRWGGGETSHRAQDAVSGQLERKCVAFERWRITPAAPRSPSVDLPATALHHVIAEAFAARAARRASQRVRRSPHSRRQVAVTLGCSRSARCSVGGEAGCILCSSQFCSCVRRPAWPLVRAWLGSVGAAAAAGRTCGFMFPKSILAGMAGTLA